MEEETDNKGKTLFTMFEHRAFSCLGLFNVKILTLDFSSTKTCDQINWDKKKKKKEFIVVHSE